VNFTPPALRRPGACLDPVSSINQWISSAGPWGIWIEIAVVPAAIAVSLLLVWLIVRP
jgi:hypothetical protein